MRNRKKKQDEAPHESASQTQPRPRSEPETPAQVIDLIGGGGWTRTNDLRIMRFRPLGTPTLFQALSCGSEPDRPVSAA